MQRISRCKPLFVGVALFVTACASSTHRMVARSVTLPQWQEVVECVRLNATPNETWVDDTGNTVRVGRNLRNGGLEEIWFVRVPTGLPTFSVQSRTKVFDPRVAWRSPLDGPSPPTRRLRQQLDAQCLGPYPVADSTSAAL